MLRRHRHAAHLTLEQLAELSGISARSLSDMERDRSKGPQQRTISAIADALKLGDSARKELIDLARDGRLRDHWARPTGLCALPRAVDDFTGRGAEMAWATDLIRGKSEPGAARVALITGAAGLGKTTLVVRAAHGLRPDFPDGVFFLDLFGMSAKPLTAKEASALLLRALGVAELRIPPELAERSSLYRSLLADRRVLVVLDNAASEEQVRPLLPGGGTARVLVTSRRLLAGLEAGRRLSLRPLPSSEATDLLTAIVGERSTSDGQEALSRLAELCGGLPLALRIVANRLASRPAWDAAGLAARLTSEERRLAQLKAGDLKIANAFGMSYEQVAGAARQLFRRLSLVPGRDFDAALAAVLGGVPAEDAWEALDELVDLGLLEDSTAGRYRFHDLVRLFARERLHAEESDAERATVAETMTSWLLRMATMAGRWFEPAYGRPDRLDPDLTELPSSGQADHWLRLNADNWLGALRLAAGSRQHQVVLNCAESMHWFSDQWIYWPSWEEVFTRGAQAAAALGDVAQQATQLNYLAWVHSVPPGNPDTTLHFATLALELATQVDARAQIAESLQHIATVQRQLGRLGEAIDSAAKAAEIHKSDADMIKYCSSLTVLAECLRVDGQYEAALEQLAVVQALVSGENSGMPPDLARRLLAAATLSVGRCLSRLGRRSEAIITLTEALTLLEQGQLPHHQAVCQQDLATAVSEEGRVAEARLMYQRAAELFETAGNPASAGRCREQAAALR